MTKYRYNITGKSFLVLIGAEDDFAELTWDTEPDPARRSRLVEMTSHFTGPWPKSWGESWYGLRTIMVRRDAPDFKYVLAHEIGHVIATDLGCPDQRNAQETAANVLAVAILDAYSIISEQTKSAKKQNKTP
jgi:hypothetical protein